MFEAFTRSHYAYVSSKPNDVVPVTAASMASCDAYLSLWCFPIFTQRFEPQGMHSINFLYYYYYLSHVCFQWKCEKQQTAKEISSREWLWGLSAHSRTNVCVFVYMLYGCVCVCVLVYTCLCVCLCKRTLRANSTSIIIGDSIVTFESDPHLTSINTMSLISFPCLSKQCHLVVSWTANLYRPIYLWFSSQDCM